MKTETLEYVRALEEGLHLCTVNYVYSITNVTILIDS